MTTYTIDPESMNITAFDQKANQAALEPGAILFQTLAQFTDAVKGWNGEQLINLWNSFAGLPGGFSELKPVKKFETRGKAVERIYKAIVAAMSLDGKPTEAELADRGYDSLPGAAEDRRTSEAAAAKRKPEPEKPEKPARRAKGQATSAPKPKAEGKAPAGGETVCTKPRTKKKYKASSGKKFLAALELVKRKGGATIDDVIKATGSSKSSAANMICAIRNVEGYLNSQKRDGVTVYSL